MSKLSLREEIKFRACQMYAKGHGTLRFGQCIYIVSHGIKPEQVDLLTSTEYDCFYLNSKVSDFLDQLCGVER